MATELATGYVSIVPSARDFGRHLTRDITPQLGGVQGGITSSFGSMFRSVALLGAGALATVGVGQFFKSAVEEAREAQRVARETEQRIATTGAAAWTSAGQVEELSGRLSRMVGIDDEVIQSGANLLLTFKNVQNQVGEGNDIFDRANGLALDMSAAFKQDLSSSAVQLGKALDNPIKGVTALQRVGVSFTEAQKEQIKTLVESGNVLDAQKIILGELETQVGGTAAAIATPWDRFGVTVGNLKEQIGAELIPILDAGATFLADNLPRALEVAGDWFNRIREPVEAFITTLRTGFTEDEGTAIEEFALKVRDLAKWIIDDLWPAIQTVVEAIGGWKEVLIAAGIVLVAIVSPVTVLTAAVIYAYTEFEGFRRIVDGVIRFFQTTVMPAVQRFAAYLVEQFANLVAWTEEHWASIEEAVGHVIVAVQAVIDTFVAYITTLWRQWGDELANITGLVWDQISLYVETAISLVRDVIRFVVALINGDWGDAWQAIKDILSTAWDFITGYIGNALQIAGQLVEGALSALRTLWDLAWEGIGAALAWAWGAIVGAVESGIRSVVDFFAGLPGRALAALGDFAGTLVGVGVEFIAGMLSGAIIKFAEVASFFSGLPGRIRGQLPDPLGLLYDIGADIIRGLINGIQDMVGRLMSIARGIARGIRDTIGDALDIFSPSKVMETMGRNIVEGLVVGMDKSAGRAEESMRSIARLMVDASSGLGLTAPGAHSLVPASALAGGAGGGPGGVIQNNTFNIDGAQDPVVTARRTALMLRMPA